jgi:hypothetical protein
VRAEEKPEVKAVGLWDSIRSMVYLDILWMEEILHHLGWLKPYNNGINHLSTQDFATIHSMFRWHSNVARSCQRNAGSISGSFVTCRKWVCL